MKGYKYTVNKRRANRLAYRFLGFMFLLVATLQAFTMIHGYAKHLVLTALFVTFVGAYGIYLVAGNAALDYDRGSCKWQKI